ncbi:uncharacterized protein PGTG_21617 [Puccinia graminis f. sp. tritici CRL 75-36-700-3]|uniref:Uncharacterized protein n=1 Tax=Puccinia graminis f. sp. tritici (strain CRL 75-36-700-3 / race SCCL) TaxID=418459 RepID=H6QS20_PUCGT|nr:uncharacterized protein PGTG_21617 [Puccinia graminis f. sp. tritici CRL 75-36-700-3]EHS63491.1 hypothetical protein PGTG_21617 [Puccinia graminis f. sp. tritici CRL 75-36-700-3]
MSRSRLLRSQSTDDLLSRNLNSYSSGACDSFYRPSSFDYQDPLDYDQGFQSRYDRRCSQSSRANERDASSYHRHPVKERHVTWAPILESATPRGIVPSTLEKRLGSNGTNAYRNSNQSCPIHGYEGQKFTVNRSPNRCNLAASSYNSWPNTTSLYEIRPSSRDISPRCNSIYGSTDPRISRDYSRYENAAYTLPHSHRYSSLSSLRSPFLNMGYYPSIGSNYHGLVNSALIPQSNLQRSKWRRSVIGLNRLSLYH